MAENLRHDLCLMTAGHLSISAQGGRDLVEQLRAVSLLVYFNCCTAIEGKTSSTSELARNKHVQCSCTE